MNCPYCQKEIFGWTGLQELQAFQRHLPKCKLNPANIALSDGRRTVVVPPRRRQGIEEALQLRADSGQ